MSKIIIILFFLFSISFAQETYKPYQEGYVEKRPYHQRTPYSFKNHSQVIEDENEMVYYVTTKGTLNPLNEELIIENIGDEDIVNPRITINGKWNWYTNELMIKEIIRDAKTDKEKAMAISQFVYNNRHYFDQDKEQYPMYQSCLDETK